MNQLDHSGPGFAILGMDSKKLSGLRSRYENRPAGEMHDPHFASVAAGQFREGGRRKWPFSGPATFLGADYISEGWENAGLDVALIGVPMDLGVSNRAGARLGPRAVRAVERIGPYEHALRVAPMQQLHAADIGDVPMASRYSLEQCHADIETFYDRVAAAGIIPLSVGGDHSISLPILKALGRRRPAGMIHIDAHCDTGGEFDGSKFHHGGPFRMAVLAGALDPGRVIQIGIRGGAEYLWEFSYESGMTVIHAEEIDRMGIPAVIAKARKVAGGGPTYISFDVDSLDPAFAPGTGTPEAGGLTMREALAIFRGLAGINVIGGDVVEVAPQYDSTTATAQCGAQALFEILSLVALRKTKPAKPVRGRART